MIITLMFISNICLPLPKGCFKTEFEKYMEDVVINYLKGELNRRHLEKLFRYKLRIVNIEENINIPIIEYEYECYKIVIDYFDIKAKKDDVIPESIGFYAKDGDEEAFPLSIFFDLCGKECYFEPRTKIKRASFKYIESESPYKLKISAVDVLMSDKNLRYCSTRAIELFRYSKESDAEE